MAKVTYNFSVDDHKNAKAFLVEGKSECGKKILIAMFYYDYGVDKENIHEAAEAFTNQLNTHPLTLEA